MKKDSGDSSSDAAAQSSSSAERRPADELPNEGIALSVAASAFAHALLVAGKTLVRRMVVAGGAVWEGLRGAASGTWSRVQLRERLETALRPFPFTRERPTSGNPSPEVSALPTRRNGRLLKTALGVLAAVVVVGSTATAAVLIWAVRDLPLSDVLPPLEEPRLELVTAKGETLYSRGAYRAAYVPLADLPDVLVDAVVAIEDRRFRSHNGIDGRAIIRAGIENLRRGGIAQGGSTISQQLVKVLYLSPERTVQRKLQEMVLAVALERQLGKDRILELYLNSVYFGAGAWGAPAAAEVYFGRQVADLSLAQAAALAAAIRAPSQVNLLADADAARERTSLVLRLMRDQGRITPKEFAAAEEHVASLAASPPPSRAGSYYADWVLEQAQELSEVVGGRITVTATLDPDLQAEAESIVAEIIEGPGRAAGANQAALVAMTPDGQVRAMVGGVNYGESQFNRATKALRQPGSTFKLPVYLTALVMGLNPDTIISDAPIEIDGWAPRNFGGGSNGQVTMTEAFARSLNAATVRLAEAIGTENIIAVSRQLGIEGPLTDGLSLALGASEVTLLDMTEAYAAILAGRLPVEATGIASLAVGETGTVLALPLVRPDAVQMTRTRQPMLDLLRAVVTSGTGRGANLPGFVAGKTGTSQEYRDAWFIGFTETLVIGVWVGNDDASPMDGVTGGSIPVDIWRSVMQVAQQAPSDGPASSPETPAPVAASPAPMQCNIRACSRAYRSFRASDCTFQPYRGERRLCTR